VHAAPGHLTSFLPLPVRSTQTQACAALEGRPRPQEEQR
jgi:hypothetical protein